MSNVFLVQHESPEVLAYAMAKYSRSAKSLKETIAEISAQKSSEFLNTFYFEYGHKSIADLAHLAVALEDISMLAAIHVVDEQRWDGQERSTRYQDFSGRQHYTPQVIKERPELHDRYEATIHSLFDGYEKVLNRVQPAIAGQLPRPASMDKAKYERTIKARAFDVARYMLPMSTLTSVGQITSGRTLEQQITRLRSSPIEELQVIGGWLKEVSQNPAGGAPTLVKYAEASAYQRESASALRNYVECHPELGTCAVSNAFCEVDLFEASSSDPATELLASLLYPHCRATYRRVRQHVSDLTLFERRDLLEMGMRGRARYEELSRAFQCGQPYQFEITMDVGGYRDFHRHRRATQLAQVLGPELGFAKPPVVGVAGCSAEFDAAANAARCFSDMLQGKIPQAREYGQYAMPMAAKQRALFKMDLAQVVYITELRTRAGGHFSYRQVAFDMARILRRSQPELTPLFDRVVHPDDGNFLDR